MGNMDVRVLTLKRWNPPQCKSIFQQGNHVYGQYVSFQNHHFFDITEVTWETDANGDIFAAAHKTAKDIRIDFYKKAVSNDIYIQQNMILFGEKNEFWNQAPRERLYVTMLQLSNRDDVYMSQLVEQIRQVFTEKLGSEQWAMYYSLDFCDLVLLVKDTSLSRMQRVLWQLAPEREGSFSNIRDTITLFGYEYNFLKGCFDAYEHTLNTKSDTQTPKHVPGEQEDGTAQSDLLIALNVQDANAWTQLKVELEKITHVISYRILGRCDIQLVVRGVTDAQVIRLLYWIDHFCACEDREQETFGCYEVVMLTPYDEEYILNGQDCQMDQSLWKQARTTTDILLRQYEEVLQNKGIDIDGYAFEFNRALLALMKNGFAEEFALGAFQSFLGYLSCCVDATKEIEEKPDLFYAFQHKFFRALSALGQCVMHGERQFIQAPGFNASLFDVPPKLVAFYAGVADKITQVLDYEQENRAFFFLFCPDFRPDFYVKPITFGAEGKYKLCILYLNEKIFYNPVATIDMMCHEIAHYVGNKARYREERTKAILECICAYLLYTALPAASAEEGLVDILADAFSEQILEAYRESLKNSDISQATRYYLTSINQYIETNNYLMTLLKQQNFVERLQERCANALEKINISGWIDMQDTTLHSDFLKNLYDSDSQNHSDRATIAQCRKAATYMLCGFFIERILAQGQALIKAELDRSPKQQLKTDKSHIPDAYPAYCQNIQQAFSEAYSDLRMVELLKISEGDVYETLSRENLQQLHTEREFGTWDIEEFQTKLRYAGVRQVLDGSALYMSFQAENEIEEKIWGFCLKKLTGYLSICHNEYKESEKNNLPALIESLQGNNAKQQFSTIRSEIVDYRKRLQPYCEKVYNEKRGD